VGPALPFRAPLSTTHTLTVNSLANTADDHPMIKPQDTARRAGDNLRLVATIFEDMLRCNTSSSWQVARVLCGRTSVDCLGRIGGCQPPRLEAIPNQEDQTKPMGVAAVLFQAYDGIETAKDPEFRNFFCRWLVETAKDPEFRNLLLASILLRFLPRLIYLLTEHPDKAYGPTAEGAWAGHKFLQELKLLGSIKKGWNNHKNTWRSPRC
jgi:hypothetical protein